MLLCSCRGGHSFLGRAIEAAWNSKADHRVSIYSFYIATEIPWVAETPFYIRI